MPRHLFKTYYTAKTLVIIYYLIVIGLVAGVTFSFDKYAAKQGLSRVPELLLHLLELLGGVFLVIPLMYVLRHKCRKFSYFIITYLILLVWLAAIYFIFIQQQTY